MFSNLNWSKFNFFSALAGCCIYKKPTQFGESSSSDSDDECEHCHGHVDKKKQRKQAREAVNCTIDDVLETIPPSENDQNKNDE